MPPVPKTGAPLYALVTVKALEASLPEGLTIGEVWMIFPNGQLLPAREVHLRESNTPNQLQATAKFDGALVEGKEVRVGVILSDAGSLIYLTSGLISIANVY